MFALLSTYCLSCSFKKIFHLRKKSSTFFVSDLHSNQNHSKHFVNWNVKNFSPDNVFHHNNFLVVCADSWCGIWYRTLCCSFRPAQIHRPSHIFVPCQHHIFQHILYVEFSWNQDCVRSAILANFKHYFQ